MFKQMICIVAVAGLVFSALVVLPATARANLIDNGSFESDILALPGTYQQPQNLTDWLESTTVALTNRIDGDPNHSYPSPVDGDNYINLHGSGTPDAVWVSQDFAVTAGWEYTVSFYAAGRATDSQVHMVITVAAGSATGETDEATGTFPVAWQPDATWYDFSYSFTPDTTTTATLKLSDIGSPNGSLLDHVVVTGVPEPGTMALLAFGGLGVLLRRKRR